MKRILLILVLLLPAALMAQAPLAFKYQAVARNSDGSVIDNRMVSFRISLLRGTVTGDIVYSERHNANTNEFGLVTLDIGRGTVISGNLSTVPWGDAAFFIKVEMDPNGGTAYQLTGTSQLLSVPYALHANTVETGDQWGSQTVVTDVTLGGDGILSSPLRVADNAITSAKIADQTITANDLASNSVTASKIFNGSVTPEKISTVGASANDVMLFNGSAVTWDAAPGSLLKYTVIGVDCANAPTFTTDWTKVDDLGTVTKLEAGSRLEITFSGRIYAATLTSTGARFELRVDNVATTNSRARAIIRSAEAGGTGVAVCFTGLFTGLSAGSHTVSMWVQTSSGTGTNAMVDPGCWSSDVIIVKEIK
jgi:hypothetical protein